MEKIKLTLSVILGVIGTFFGKYGTLILLVVGAIVFDLITGLIRAKVDPNDAWSSEKCSKGLFKKLALLVGLAFGFFLDWFIPFILIYVNVTIPFSMPFAMIICFYIVLNECISICENLYATNSEIMPKWIVNLLVNVKDRITDDVVHDDESRRQ